MKIDNTYQIQCTNKNCGKIPPTLEINSITSTKVKCGICDAILVEIPEDDKNVIPAIMGNLKQIQNKVEAEKRKRRR